MSIPTSLASPTLSMDSYGPYGSYWEDFVLFRASAGDAVLDLRSGRAGDDYDHILSERAHEAWLGHSALCQNERNAWSETRRATGCHATVFDRAFGTGLWWGRRGVNWVVSVTRTSQRQGPRSWHHSHGGMRLLTPLMAKLESNR
ncbi:hypothetical protein C8Q76DRAFT_700837 [Earliella scabrosa]|nr:hypothetical protein C8Q76DRAFT_700837 [Earliella scabrosa]